jgi:putative transposase
VSRDKVVKPEVLRNRFPVIFAGVQDRVLDLAVEILSGVEVHLSSRLHGIGLEVIKAIMATELEEVIGIKGKHLRDRRFVRGGTNPGSVIINGAKVACQIPRAKDVETGVAYELQSHGFFQRTGELVKKGFTDLIRGVSTRRYAEGIEAFVQGYGISAASISRHVAGAMAKKVEEFFTRSLAEIDLAVLMLDGIAIGDFSVVIALGIDTQGEKHILGIRQGATENTELVKSLLMDIVERGISRKRPPFVVIDGGKALRKAVRDVFGALTPIQRCTVHKKRNVLSHLLQKHHGWVSTRLTQAYNESSYNKALKMLTDLADQLESISPDAARSLREGIEETLTAQRLELPELLRVSLRSTNAIESLNGVVRDRGHNVKRWTNGAQVERWTVAAVMENEKRFRRIKGYKQLPFLLNQLENISAQTQVA